MSTQASHIVAERAYLIWEQMGRPDGQALEHWLRAEAELSTPQVTPLPGMDPVPSMSRRGRRKKA